MGASVAGPGGRTGAATPLGIHAEGSRAHTHTHTVSLFGLWPSRGQIFDYLT